MRLIARPCRHTRQTESLPSWSLHSRETKKPNTEYSSTVIRCSEGKAGKEAPLERGRETNAEAEKDGRELASQSAGRSCRERSSLSRGSPVCLSSEDALQQERRARSGRSAPHPAGPPRSRAKQLAFTPKHTRKA